MTTRTGLARYGHPRGWRPPDHMICLWMNRILDGDVNNPYGPHGPVLDAAQSPGDGDLVGDALRLTPSHYQHRDQPGDLLAVNPDGITTSTGTGR